MTCADLKPGDKALLIYRGGWMRRERVQETTVRKVYKNGLIVVDDADCKFRPTGSPARKYDGFQGAGYCLEPFSAERLEAYEAQWKKEEKAERLHSFAKGLERISTRDTDAAATLWDALPAEWLALVQKHTEPPE